MLVQDLHIHPLLQQVITRIIDKGLGEVVMSPDGHFFFEPNTKVWEYIRGSIEQPEDREAYGMRVIIRKRRTGVKQSKYKGYPPYIIYPLPIIQKNADTMTDAERRNIEIHTEAINRAHAIMADPERLTHYQELHAAHIREHELHPNRPPQGYRTFYPNLFGFLVATLHAQLTALESATKESAPTAAQQPTDLIAAPDSAPIAAPTIIAAPQECPVLAISDGEFPAFMSPSSSISPESDSGISLLVPHIPHIAPLIPRITPRLPGIAPLAPRIRLPSAAA